MQYLKMNPGEKVRILTEFGYVDVSQDGTVFVTVGDENYGKKELSITPAKFKNDKVDCTINIIDHED